MSRPVAAAVILSAAAIAMPAHADTPSFDRPGIAFSTGTLPRGGFAWEQGLPDFERDKDDATRSTTYRADTTLRLGLSERIELQLASAPYNYLRERDLDGRRSRHGAGDTGVALKVALPSAHDKFSWAVLGGVTAASGDREFSNGATQYALGTTLAYDFSDALSGSLYVNVERSDGADTWTWSPSLSYAFNERFGAYVEAGFSHADHQPSESVAGVGVTFMATSKLQLDASLDAGLDRDSPDLQGGVGVSLYFD